MRSSPYQSAPHTPSSSCWRDKCETQVVGQEREQVELTGREGNDLAGPAGLATTQVDLQVSDGDHLLRGGALPRPPQNGPHPCHQLPGREGLDQIVVRSQLQPENAVHLVVACREEQHRHGASGPDSAADVEAVTGSGQPDIEDDDAGTLPREKLQSLLAVMGQEHPETLPAQVEIHQVGNVRVVFDDDHRPALCAHLPSLPSPASRNCGKMA